MRNYNVITSDLQNTSLIKIRDGFKLKKSTEMPFTDLAEIVCACLIFLGIKISYKICNRPVAILTDKNYS